MAILSRNCITEELLLKKGDVPEELVTAVISFHVVPPSGLVHNSAPPFELLILVGGTVQPGVVFIAQPLCDALVLSLLEI